MPLGIKSIAPIRRQPVRERLNAPVSGSLGMVAMISGQRLSRQYKPGDFLAIRPLNWDEIIDEDDDDDNWADPGVTSGGSSHHGNGNDNEDGEGEEDMQGAEKRTGKGKRTKDWMGKGKGKEKGNGKGRGNGKVKGIVYRTPGGDDISCAVASQLQKKMSEADLDKEG